MANKDLVKSSRYLLNQSQQWKHQGNVWNMFKVNNKDNKNKHCSGVSSFDFQQVNTSWEIHQLSL